MFLYNLQLTLSKWSRAATALSNIWFLHYTKALLCFVVEHKVKKKHAKFQHEQVGNDKGWNNLLKDLYRYPRVILLRLLLKKDKPRSPSSSD